jgi:hypothetical protein
MKSVQYPENETESFSSMSSSSSWWYFIYFKNS